MNVELPQKWMIATDGSQFAEQSLKYASELYKLIPEKPDVHIVNVVSDPMGVGPEGLKREIAQAEKLLEKGALKFSDEGKGDKHIHLLIEVGEPRKVLADLLKRLEIEHLFMGGADFSTGAVDVSSGGITNYMLHRLKGTVTIMK